jgi:hypothetical protein
VVRMGSAGRTETEGARYLLGVVLGGEVIRASIVSYMSMPDHTCHSRLFDDSTYSDGCPHSELVFGQGILKPVPRQVGCIAVQYVPQKRSCLIRLEWRLFRAKDKPLVLQGRLQRRVVWLFMGRYA